MTSMRCLLGWLGIVVLLGQPAGGEERPALAFRFGDGGAWHFATGSLEGTLRPDGRSLGLAPLRWSDSQTPIADAYGVLSHYRVFTSERRFGNAAWEWPSAAAPAEDGGVEIHWEATEDRPFEMRAVYAWRAADTLDVTTTVTARERLPGFELFLASYFAGGFTSSRVYARQEPGGETGFLEAQRSAGVWQMFPRDEAAVAVIGDGRWRHEPHPVAWEIRPALAAPLALRRDQSSGLTALVMAPAEDCFAVSTPYSEEGHRSLYLSLFGRDIAAGETASARARLVVAPRLSDEDAVTRYRAYIEGL